MYRGITCRHSVRSQHSSCINFMHPLPIATLQVYNCMCECMKCSAAYTCMRWRWVLEGSNAKWSLTAILSSTNSYEGQHCVEMWVEVRVLGVLLGGYVTLIITDRCALLSVILVILGSLWWISEIVEFGSLSMGQWSRFGFLEYWQREKESEEEEETLP